MIEGHRLYGEHRIFQYREKRAIAVGALKRSLARTAETRHWPERLLAEPLFRDIPEQRS